MVNPVIQRVQAKQQYMREHDIPEKHDILNYLHQPKSLITTNILGPKRGLVLCKGHTHGPLIKDSGYYKDLPQDIQWVYMDIDINTNPDIIGDITSYESYERAGLSNYDYVYVSGCPNYITDILRGSRMVLKPGGKLIYPAFLYVIKLQIARDPEKKSFLRKIHNM